MDNNKDIKHRFELKNGAITEIMLRPTDNGVIQVTKHILPDGYCVYYSGGYYLDSFDGTHHKDYPIEEILNTIDEDGCHDYKTCFWDHD